MHNFFQCNTITELYLSLSSAQLRIQVQGWQYYMKKNPERRKNNSIVFKIKESLSH